MKIPGQKHMLHILVVGLMLIGASCSNQRVDQNHYSEPEEFMYDNRPEEQEFTITGEGEGPIVGNQGTRLWMDTTIFMFPNGDAVSYPFTLKLIELYTPKDMELYDMPTVAQGNMLVTGGEIRVRAFKDGQELVLIPGQWYHAQVPSANPVSQMSIFYGQEANGIMDWQDDVTAVSNNAGIESLEYIAIDSTDSFYDMRVPVMDWINCDYFYDYDPSAVTTVSYTSEDDNLDNVMIFLYFNDIGSVMRVYDEVSGNVPIGASVKSLCFAQNTAGNMAYHYDEFAITENHTVQVTMTEIAEADLIALMQGL